MIVPILATCLGLSAVPQGDEADHKSVLRVWPIHTALAVTPPTPAVPVRTLTGESRGTRLVGSAEPMRSVEADYLAQYVKQMSGGETIFDAEGGLTMDYMATRALIICGPKGLMAHTAETLARLRAHWTRSVEVRAKLYAWDGKPHGSSTVRADQLAELTRGKTPIWSGSMRTRNGHPTQLGGLREWRVPPTDETDELVQRTGTQVVVAPHAMIGTDDLVVFCQLALGARHDAVAPQPGVAAKALEIDSVTMSGRIPDGGALLYSAQSAHDRGRSVLLAVECRWLQPRPQPPDDALILPVGGLVTSTLGTFSGLDEFGLPNTENEDEGYSLAFDEGKLIDLLRSVVTPDAWDQGGTSISSSNGVLYVTGGKTTLSEVDALVREQQALWIHNTQVQLQTLLVGGEGQSNRAALHRVSFPALANRAHVVVHGIEQPGENRARLSGLTAVIEPWDERGEGGARAEIALHDAVGFAREVVRLQHSGPVRRTDTLDFGDGPAVKIDGQARRTRQLFRLLPR